LMRMPRRYAGQSASPVKNGDIRHDLIDTIHAASAAAWKAERRIIAPFID